MVYNYATQNMCAVCVCETAVMIINTIKNMTGIQELNMLEKSETPSAD